MKKLLLFFIFIYLIGCSDARNQNTKVLNIECPRVFFSLENNLFIDGAKESTDLEEINYKATLNNYGFVKNCFNDSEKYNYNLDLLIIIDPINPKDEKINLPLFVLFYNMEGKLLDSQYFRVENKLIYNNSLSEYETTNVIKNLNIYLKANQKVSSMTIGFVKIKNK